MTNIGKESIPIEIMVLQASGIVIETLLFVAKEVPIIKSFAHILQGNSASNYQRGIHNHTS